MKPKPNFLLAMLLMGTIFAPTVSVVLLFQSATIVASGAALVSIVRTLQGSSGSWLKGQGLLSLVVVLAVLLCLALQLMSSFDERIRARRFFDDSSPYSGMEYYLRDVETRVGGRGQDGD